MRRVRYDVMTTLLSAGLCVGSFVHSARAEPLRPQAQPTIRLTPAAAQVDVHRHSDALDGAQELPKAVRLEAVPVVINAPKVQVGIEPMEGSAIVYHAVAAPTSTSTPTAQVSVLLGIKNLSGQSLTLEKVRFEYQGGSKELAVSGVSGANNQTLWWQNGREYHQAGDVLYLDGAIPTSLTLKLYFTGFSAPVLVTKPLKPYARSFGLPFKASDLRKDELWESGSTHGGGSQVFAYDMGVEGYDKSFGALLPGKSSKANDSYRVWGKPVYAMADGEVAEAVNDCPNNPAPAQGDADMEKQKNDWKAFPHGGAGNHLYVQHGDVIALYAHMQKGSINPKLLTKGSKVKKGDFLGLAGNSGNSSAPHLHVHLRKETSIETGPYRPLMFDEGFAIAKKSYTAPSINVSWSKLDHGAIPGFAGERSYIWPAATHPYCAYAPNGSEVAKHGLAAADYQREFDKIWTCGYYPAWVDGYDVAGKTYFNLVMRPDDGKPWVARHNLSGAAYQSEFDKWAQAGLRLVHVDSYVRAGNVEYAAVWRKDGGPAINAYHGASAAQHQANFDTWVKQGWVPVAVSIVAPGGEPRVTALYHKLDTGGLYARNALTLADYQAAFKQYGDQGFKLVYINGYNVKGTPMLSAIWHKSTPFGGYIAKHHLTGAQYQTEYTSQTGSGFNTRSVTGYESGGAARFEGLWVK